MHLQSVDIVRAFSVFKCVCVKLYGWALFFLMSQKTEAPVRQ